MKNDNRITAILLVITLIVAFWAYGQIVNTAAADEITHRFKNPSFSGIGTSAHYLTIENQERTRSDAIREKRRSDEEKRMAAAKNTNFAKFKKNLESRIYARFSKELEEAVFGEACGTRWTTATYNSGTSTYSEGTASTVPDQIVQGESDIGGDCDGTITVDGTTMSWKKVVTADDPYVELTIAGPDGSETFNMPLNKLQF